MSDHGHEIRIDQVIGGGFEGAAGGGATCFAGGAGGAVWNAGALPDGEAGGEHAELLPGGGGRVSSVARRHGLHVVSC